MVGVVFAFDNALKLRGRRALKRVAIARSVTGAERIEDGIRAIDGELTVPELVAQSVTTAIAR